MGWVAGSAAVPWSAVDGAGGTVEAVGEGGGGTLARVFLFRPQAERSNPVDTTARNRARVISPNCIRCELAIGRQTLQLQHWKVFFIRRHQNQIIRKRNGGNRHVRQRERSSLLPPRRNKIARHFGDFRRDRKEGETPQKPLGPPFLTRAHSRINLGNGDRARRQCAAPKQKLLHKFGATALPVQNIYEDAGVEKVNQGKTPGCLPGGFQFDLFEPLRRAIPQFPNECVRAIDELRMVCVAPATHCLAERCKLLTALDFLFQEIDNEGGTPLLSSDLVDPSSYFFGNGDHCSCGSHTAS